MTAYGPKAHLGSAVINWDPYDSKASLKDGSLAVWKGPIMDNTGKELLAKGVTADDKFPGGLKTHVKRVEGKVPGGN